MRRLLLATFMLSLASCISFPRAERMARDRKVLGTDGNLAPSTQEYGAPVKARENFKDRYFR